MLSTFRIDLNEIDGEGEFPCPKCHVMISPDDESEEVYRVLDILENENGHEFGRVYDYIKEERRSRIGYLELRATLAGYKEWLMKTAAVQSF